MIEIVVGRTGNVSGLERFRFHDIEENLPLTESLRWPKIQQIFTSHEENILKINLYFIPFDSVSIYKTLISCHFISEHIVAPT